VERELGVDASIERGNAGEFTVWLDGDVVFSKAVENRFPEPDEIVARLRA
jgi:predicted Rdx family selenoprotein